MIDKVRLNEIMASDMKLWDEASKTDDGQGNLTLTLDLPHGIGETTITLQGVTDGQKRRVAFEAYGNYIRGLIRERIDDDAVEARAKAAAARAKQDDREDSLVVDQQGVPYASSPAEVVEGPEDTYREDAEPTAGVGATLLAQRAKLAERVGRAEANLAQWRRELKALDAACRALEEEDEDAPADTETPD